MRFLISSNIKANKPLFVTVVLFLLISLVFWIASWLYYHAKFGLTYSRMQIYFFTDPRFPEKLPLSQLLEDIHINLFINLIFLLVVASIFLHKCVRDSFKYTLISLSFLFGLLDPVSGFAVYFLGETFIYLKIFSFVVYQISIGMMLLLSLKLYLTKEKEEPPERSILYAVVFVFSVSSVLFALINFFLFFEKLGFSPLSVAGFYAGDPQRFIRPKSFEGILEVAFPHLVAMGIYLFALVHFAFFTNVKRKTLLSIVALASAFADIVSGFLIRFVHPSFSYLKLISFLSLNLSIIYLSLVIAISILKHRAKAIVVL